MKRSFLQTKIEFAVSTDELRPAMCCAYFKDGFVYATTAHIAVKQSLSAVHRFSDEEIALLDNKMIHGKILKKLHGHDDYKVTKSGIEAKDGWAGRITYHFYDGNERYPDIDAVIPTGKEVNKPGFGINAKYLDMLSKAMFGSNYGLLFEFKEGSSAIVVKTKDFDCTDQLGIIMPVSKSNY